MATRPDRQAGTAQRSLPDPRLVMAALFLAALIPMLVTPVLAADRFLQSSGALFRAGAYRRRSRAADLLSGALDVAAGYRRGCAGDAAAAVCSAAAGGQDHRGRYRRNSLQRRAVSQSRLTGQRSLLIAVLLLPLLYSYIFNFGFANFLLGLGFAFWAAGWWLSHRDRPRLAVPVSCLFAVAIFFTHGLAFGLYGILVASLEVGFLHRHTRAPAA